MQATYFFPKMNDFSIEEVTWQAAQDELRGIRTRVFIEEQNVPEELEWDGLDEDCWHVLARSPRGEAIGTGRLLRDGHIGRMAVLAPWRGKGVGTALLLRLLEIAQRESLEHIELAAQNQAIPFYERLGFTLFGEEFMDAGIPHRNMARQLPFNRF
jgi:predicted GNAT family N-acyltransferase